MFCNSETRLYVCGVPLAIHNCNFIYFFYQLKIVCIYKISTMFKEHCLIRRESPPKFDILQIIQIIVKMPARKGH